MGKHELEDDLPSEENDDSAEEDEDEEPYPPWLHNIVTGDHYDLVKVIKEEDDKSQPGYIRCKEVVVPDAADAADKKQNIRKYILKKYTVVMIVSEPDTAPYIGLIDKIWRKTVAKPVNAEAGTYKLEDFMLECYWFYRPREVPAEAWENIGRRTNMSGAQFAWSKRIKPELEKSSERQLLFSSHHTLHDYPDQNGLLSLEGFLQVCEPVHWIGLRDPPPEKYCIHKRKLIRVREPGFVVQGFLWCNAKKEPQLESSWKRVYSFDMDWQDRETMKIVAHMREKYQARAQKVAVRNEEIIRKYSQYIRKQQAGQAGPSVSSDSGGLEGPPQQQQQQGQQVQQQRRPPQRGASSDSDEDIPIAMLPRMAKSSPQSTGAVKLKAGSGAAGAGGASKPAAGVDKVGGVQKQQQQQQQGAAGSPIAAAATAAVAGGAKKHGEFGSDDDDE